ncbi:MULTISPECIES: TetR/AcrR family transcriptional regulator [unclassified Rhodococcus (in: high G+C Gram-positive bacteria)]|uniref:TetR/AcrR family transcriptional regulator n=1 Tax=unclassified Rhodococcus (in: high G+C Gram-positive bacteria) TaxID=192944 RepID=UPI000BCE05D6|nr:MULTISPECIES: TetR/AcrR family transcriptional regulator [unclassified Rhodococcus (in: high G+C Gram-positive bacteria)]MBP1161029.1 AcrR family transcriptional regulator [Rhodococcus sp. PvR099]PTR39423.1 TetR family transcriptional regulator [Rhodococcus sp. OK611]SNX92574.1 transcriptional regulator, TetR family [Rhodococcus sp. OK270]
MARTTFSTDALLDAAREVILERGPRSATIALIAARAGAPTGSIYHRFASIDELLARTWLRAVRRTQQVRPAGFDPAGEPVEVVVELALALYDHCVAEPGDMLLLDRLRREDVLHLNLGDELIAEVGRSDEQTGGLIAELARAVFGRAGKRETDLVVLALVDLPYSFAGRYLQAGARPPKSRRDRLPDAVRAIVATRPHD